MPEDFVIVYATFPDAKTARRIIKGLIKSRLVACGNIFKLSSLYIWKGAIEQNPEYGAFMKTKRRNYTAVEKYVVQHHPYDVPEIILWPIERGFKKYLQWIEEETDQKRKLPKF